MSDPTVSQTPEVLPFGREFIPGSSVNDWDSHWRIFDKADNCIATCYDSYNAQQIVDALNRDAGRSPEGSGPTDALREALCAAGYALHDAMGMVNTRMFCEAECPHAKCEDDPCQCGNEADREKVATAYRAVLAALRSNPKSPSSGGTDARAKIEALDVFEADPDQEYYGLSGSYLNRDEVLALFPAARSTPSSETDT
jgi:hypothetical protein